MRRYFKILFIIIFFVSIFSCGKVKDNTFKVMIWGGPEEYISVKNNLENYKKIHPDFNYNIIQYPANRYDEFLQLYFLQNQPPDLMYVSREWFPFYASNNLLTSLDEFISKDISFDTSDFYPKLIDSFKYNNKLYGIAKDFTTLVLYYNKDLFKKAGIAYPDNNWKWKDFLNAALKLTKDTDGDGKIDQFGFAQENWFLEIAPWLWQNGSKIVENNKWVMGDKNNRKTSIEAIQFLVDMIYKYKVSPNPKIMSKLGGGGQMFMTGKAAMCTYGRWSCLQFRNIDNFSWGIAHLPSQKTKAAPIFTVSWAISKQSAKKDLAWSVLKYFVGNEVQIDVAKSGLAIPVRKSIASSSYFLHSAGLPSSIHQGIFLDAMDYSKFLNTVPQWADIADAINKEFEPVFKENKPVDKAVDDLQKHIENILSQ